MSNQIMRTAMKLGLVTATAINLGLSTAYADSFPGYVLKVKLIGGEQYEALYNAVIPQWERETGAKVDILSRKNHFELDKEIKQDIASGNIDYCLSYNHTSFAPQYVSIFQDLNKILPADYIAKFNKRAIQNSTIDGQLIQLPRHSDISALYYIKSLYTDSANKKAYRDKYKTELAPPQTWEEFSRQAKFFSKPPKMYGSQFPGKDEAISGRFYEMLLANGGQMFDKNWKPTFNSPAGVKALDFFVDLYKSNAVPKGVPNYLWDDLGQNFASGTIALDLDWGGWAGFFNDPKNSKVANNVGIVRAPKGSAGIRTGWSGSHSFSITKACDNVPAAKSLLMAFTSLDAQLVEARKGLLPTRDDAITAALAEFSKKGDTFALEVAKTYSASMAEDSVTVPQTPQWIEISNVLWPELQKAILGEKTSKEALDTAAQKVTTIMKESGELKE